MELAASLLSLSLVISGATGEPVSMETFTRALATHDVVFLGEEHDNTVGHQMQLETVRRLHALHDDLVISMEMFERDCQGVLDDYLRGRIDEKTFLKNSRPWGNYRRHYRGIIEFAKAKGIDVIAANVPRRIARRMSFRGAEAVAESGFRSRTTTAPDDRYFDLFKDAMSGHMGAEGGDAMRRMYQAQCLKDDTMAESIVDYRSLRPYRRPLIVHLCGKFHSDSGLGTVVRVLQRAPLTRVAVVSTHGVEDVHGWKGGDDLRCAHWHFVVPAEKKKEKAPKEAAAEIEAAMVEEESVEEEIVEDPVVVDTELVDVTEAPTSRPAQASRPAPTSRPKATSRPTEKAEVAEAKGGRAALGIMPDYDSDEDGVAVTTVREDGPADTAGVEDGDRIVAIAGKSVMDLDDYMNVMDGLRAGQKIKIVVVRKGKRHELKVTLGTSHR